MFRAFILALALVGSPALANAHYHAEPAAAPAATKLVLRDLVWKCGDGACSAAKTSSSRPAIVCALLVKQVGTLKSFSANGQALSAEQLEKCNGRAN